jgi:hypothetical protein
MKIHRNMIQIAALGAIVFTLPANAQLIGGSLNGYLDGAVGSRPAGGWLQGGVLTGAELGGDITSTAGDTAGSANGQARGSAQAAADDTRGTAGRITTRTRESADKGADKVRQVPGRVQGAARASAAAATTHSQEASGDATDGSPRQQSSPDLGLNGATAAQAAESEARVDAVAQGRGSASDEGISADSTFSGSARAGKLDSSETTQASQ